MKPELQRLAIAEAYGYQRLTGDPWRSIKDPSFMPPGMSVLNFIRRGERAVYLHRLPDYLNDLNAMKCACRKLLTSPELRRQFIIHLCGVCNRRFGNSEIDPSDVLDPNEMTQMMFLDVDCGDYAEAFLRTLNLWEATA